MPSPIILRSVARALGNEAAALAPCELPRLFPLIPPESGPDIGPWPIALSLRCARGSFPAIRMTEST